MLREGKPLGGSWDGGWGAQPKPLSTALPESPAVYVCSLLMAPQPMLELFYFSYVLLRSPPPRHSPAHTLDVTRSPFFGITLFLLMVPVTPCSYSSLHSRSVLPATVLDTGDRTVGRGGPGLPTWHLLPCWASGTS